MDDIKRENSKNVQKNHKVRTRMVTVRVLNMHVEETADIQGRNPNRVRDRLRRHDEGDDSSNIVI